MREIRGGVFQGRFHNLLISKNNTFWAPQISRITFQVVNQRGKVVDTPDPKWESGWCDGSPSGTRCSCYRPACRRQLRVALLFRWNWGTPFSFLPQTWDANMPADGTEGGGGVGAKGPAVMAGTGRRTARGRLSKKAANRWREESRGRSFGTGAPLRRQRRICPSGVHRPTGKRSAMKVARSVWKGGKTVKSYLSLRMRKRASKVTRLVLTQLESGRTPTG